MTAEQYWDEDCNLVKYYRRAANIKRDLDNQAAWLQGVYFHEALVCAAPLFRDFVKRGVKVPKYRDKPYDISPPKRKTSAQKQREEKEQMAKAKEHMMAMMETINQRFKKGGENHGG